jgi:tetratricopeptide (TPR) repeat protein
MEVIRSNTELVKDGRTAEAANDLEAAASLYEKAIKNDPLQENVYDRLMIIYRKLKQYKAELRIINAGIKAYENYYKPKARGVKAKRVEEISLALLKSTGLTDKKGNHMYDPEPIGKWKKRKLVVEKKVKKS